MTIVLSRFVPILRTCAPFVAGVARMPYGRFQAYNVAGGVAWVLSLVWAGLLLRQPPVHQGQLRPRDHRHHRGVDAAGGLGGAEGGIEEVSSAYRSFAHRVDIGVPVERVWRAFTDSRVLARWTAAGATITPREKGRLHVMFGGDVELDAHIDVLVTPQRMRLILLPTRGMPDARDAVIVEDFLFERARRRPPWCGC